jgi:hypothetical protein
MSENKCQICGGAPPNSIQKHHLIPRRYGGSDADENMVALCANCHAAIEVLYGKQFWDRLFRHFLNSVGFDLEPDLEFSESTDSRKQVGRPRKLEEDQLAEVDDLHENGVSYSNIARLMESDPQGPESISRETIRRYCTNDD